MKRSDEFQYFIYFIISVLGEKRRFYFMVLKAKNSEDIRQPAIFTLNMSDC